MSIEKWTDMIRSIQNRILEYHFDLIKAKDNDSAQRHAMVEYKESMDCFD